MLLYQAPHPVASPMPRIRSIKPEFWEDEKIGAVSREARLLFICTWNLADDCGNLRATPRYLRLQAFPYDDDLRDEDVARMLNQLSRRGLVRLYEVRGEHYANVTNLDRHQYKKPGRTLVAKCPTLSDDESNEIKQLQGFDRDKPGQDYPMSALPHPHPHPHPRSLSQSQEPLSSSPKPEPDAPASQVVEVFEHWRETLKHPRTKLTADRRGKIRARLKEGATVADLKAAIDGCASSSHHMGENDAGKVYDSIGLIFRNAEKVDEMRGYLRARPRRAGAAQQFERTDPAPDNGGEEPDPLDELDRWREKVNDPIDGPALLSELRKIHGRRWWKTYGFDSDPVEAP